MKEMKEQREQKTWTAAADELPSPAPVFSTSSSLSDLRSSAPISQQKTYSNRTTNNSA